MPSKAEDILKGFKVNWMNLRDADTGKSLSEALIFESTNPQYEDRLFIELHTSSIHKNSMIKPGENRNCF